MRRENRKRIVLLGCTVTVLAVLACATGCMSIQTHSPIAEDTRIAIVDSVTQKPIGDADIFRFTMLEANGCFPFGEAHWRDIRYHYAGHLEMPCSVPPARYRTISYNFLLWQRRPTRCYTAVVVYKRGYLTKLWVPGNPKQVPLLSIANSNMNDKGLGEGEIDWLLQLTCLRSPDRSRFYWTREDALRGRARALKRYVSDTQEFNRVVEFAVGEYKALLDTDLSSDPRTRPRLLEKIARLSELTTK